MVIGPTRVEIRVVPPAETKVVRVEIGVDGRVLASLFEPPWVLTWDADDGTRAHSLYAVAHFSDASTARAALETIPLRIHSVEHVNLVNLFVVVRDADGRYVAGLEKSDFTLLEDGREQEIKLFTEAPKPLAVAIVLDASSTMEGRKLAAARGAARSFLEVLSPVDEAAVISFSEHVRLLQHLTRDSDQLERAILDVDAGGGTAIYDAIWEATELLCGSDARLTIVLLSDGRDEAAGAPAPGSVRSLEEALNHALRCDVMIFVVGFGNDLNRVSHDGRHTHAEILTALGEKSGGRTLFAGSPGALGRTFEAVAADLRHQYAVTYTSDNEAMDGSWREIRLIPRRPELEVTTRTGYFAGETAEVSEPPRTPSLDPTQVAASRGFPDTWCP